MGVLNFGDLLSGTEGRQYFVGKQISTGPFGEVYLGYLCEGMLPCAIKCVYNSNDAIGSLRRWQREAKILSQLRGQPGIVSYIDAFSHGLYGIIVLERAVCSVKDWIGQHRLSPFDVWEYATQLFGALIPLHAGGFLHRDIKSSNVLLFPNRSLKLADFGISSAVSMNEQAPSPSFRGYCRCMPPEILAQQQSTVRTDIYQAAHVVLEMLLSRHLAVDVASPDERDALIRGGYPRLLAEDIADSEPHHATVARFLSIALRRRPQFRFASAAEAFAELVNAGMGAPIFRLQAPSLAALEYRSRSNRPLLGQPSSD